jgi:hypothetical protein
LFFSYFFFFVFFLLLFLFFSSSFSSPSSFFIIFFFLLLFLFSSSFFQGSGPVVCSNSQLILAFSMSPLKRDRPAVKSSIKQDIATHQIKHTCVPRTGFELTIPVLQGSETYEV